MVWGVPLHDRQGRRIKKEQFIDKLYSAVNRRFKGYKNLERNKLEPHEEEAVGRLGKRRRDREDVDEEPTSGYSGDASGQGTRETVKCVGQRRDADRVPRRWKGGKKNGRDRGTLRRHRDRRKARGQRGGGNGLYG